MSEWNFSRRDLLRWPAVAAVAAAAPAQDTGVGSLYAPPGSAFRRVTLEMSLKPFRSHDEASIRQVCREVFRSWAPLLRRCDGCAVMLWSADGSEILEYRGRMDQPFDWARYLGDANPPKIPPADDPDRKGAHGRNWLYMRESAADDVRHIADHHRHSQADRRRNDRQVCNDRRHIRPGRRVCALDVQVRSPSRDRNRRHARAEYMGQLHRAIEGRPAELRGLSPRHSRRNIVRSIPWRTKPALPDRFEVRLYLVLEWAGILVKPLECHRPAI